MKSNLAQIEAVLSSRESERIDDLVKIINLNVKPPKAIKVEDIYIRAMYIVSDEINSYGGKFPDEEIDRLTSLVIDAPVMVGHRKDRLPVGRIFFAEVEEKDDHRWLKAYFYWLKKGDESENLKKNIDGGVFKECSIGFVYQMPECSICGQDIRNCRHNPQEKYSVGNDEQVCFYYYRQIEKVLEASLVYRGAVPNTSITDKLTNSHNSKNIPIGSLDELDRQPYYLVMPNYEGFDLSFNENSEVAVVHSKKSEITIDEISQLLGRDKQIPNNGFGQLIGLRGKERLSESSLKQYLKYKSGPITRIELKLFPGYNYLLKNRKDHRQKVSLIPYALGSIAELPQLINKLKTKNGVRIWAIEPELYHSNCYLHQPDKSAYDQSYKIELLEESQNALLTIRLKTIEKKYYIQNFNLKKFTDKKRFAAKELITPVNKQLIAAVNGQVEQHFYNNNWMNLKLSGELKGWLTIAPAKINGAIISLVSFHNENEVELKFMTKGPDEAVRV